jgi:hypothetical protein
MMEHLEHRINRRKDMRLGPAQRGQAQHGQAVLERPEVAAAQGQILEQVAGAVMVAGMDLVKSAAENNRSRRCFSPDGLQLFERRVKVRGTGTEIAVSALHGKDASFKA